MSYMLRRGVQFSISSDDPGLFGYEGVTLDYVYAMGAWGLNIRDLKKLTWNGIKYSSVDQKSKDELSVILEKKWHEWVKQINGE